MSSPDFNKPPYGISQTEWDGLDDDEKIIIINSDDTEIPDVEVDTNIVADYRRRIAEKLTDPKNTRSSYDPNNI